MFDKNVPITLLKSLNHTKNTALLGRKTLKKLNRVILGISFVDFVRENNPFADKPEDKISKYWENVPVQEVIKNADKLYEDEDYMGVYESLNRIKYSKNVEVLWRMSRALYNLSLTAETSHDVKKLMIEEAYEIMEKNSTIGKGQANYHKWLAVIANHRNGLESLDNKIKGYQNVRNHLLDACKSNPKDFTVQYMLGRWHYEMANLTWIQRKIAKYLFVEPPNSTYQEAYRHLVKAEDLNPRSFMPNIYLLGCVSVKLGQYYRARYYLNMILSLPMHNDCEKCYISNAQYLLSRLEKYDIGKDLLEDKFHFGFDN